MKNLLKKKPATKTAVDKKSPIKFSGFKKNKNADAQKPAKKPLFAKKTKATTPKGRTVGIDAAKLLPILIGLLVAVLAALAAYKFLLNEPEPEIVATPAVVEPVDPSTEAVATDVAVTPAEESQEPVVQTVSIDPVAIEPAAETPQLSYDDFIRESETKIYREYDTTPPVATQ